MLVTTLHFIKNDEPDEILRIYRKNYDSFKCVFQPGDIRSTFTFYLTREAMNEYINETIQMVAEDDVDPYEQVQVSTMIHPRILFHVSDLTKAEVRERVWGMIVMSWNSSLVKNGLSNNRSRSSNAHP
jgi:hypothetical protein